MHQSLVDVPSALVEQFRQEFLKRYSKECAGTAKESFDKRDVEGMLDDIRIRGYLVLAENNLDTALKSTRDMFLWRNEFKVRDIQLSDFPPTFLRGGMFYRNKDLDGNNVFWNRVRFNKKGEMNNEKKRIFAYMLEQHYQKFKGEKVTFVFDMTECGLGQADLDVLRFMINCFQHNFPFIVNNLVVYKLPWILEGIWKIVKTWLPAKSQEKVKFVSAPDAVDKYISRENRFIHVAGGTDTFTEMHGDGDRIFLTYSDLYCGTPRRGGANSSFSSECGSIAGGESLAQPSVCESATINGTIVSSSPSVSSNNSQPRSPPPETASEAIGLDPGTGGQATPQRKASTISASTPKAEVKKQHQAQVTTPSQPKLLNRSVSSNIEPLEFSPDSTIVFDKNATSHDLIEASIYLKNVSGNVVAFKVKSTSMTRYRSRPCAGFIQPGTSRHVHISCRLQDRAHLPHDRFLVQYLQVSDTAIEGATRGGVPPATAASQLLSSKHPNEKLFEKRMTPAASNSLPPIGQGDQVGKTHATPTPPPTHAHSNNNNNNNLDVRNDRANSLALNSMSNFDDFSKKVIQELEKQRRTQRFILRLLVLQLLLFVAYVLVFHIYPDEFHSVTERLIDQAASLSSSSSKKASISQS